MCIIALKPEGVVLPEYTLRTMWEGNPHGAGFMYAENGQLKIVKGLMTFDDFCAAYLDAGVRRKIVMHFRIRTSGATSAEMTHPFKIVNGLGMVHNGIISKVETTAHKSDTAVFAELIAQEYTNPIEMIRNKFHRDMLATYIGSYNKLVFMDATGRTHIINETAGTRDVDGTWYSNGGFRASRWNYTAEQWAAATGEDVEDDTLEMYMRRRVPDVSSMNLDDNKPGWLSRATHKGATTGSAGTVTTTTTNYRSRESLWDAAAREREQIAESTKNRAKAKERAKERRARRLEESKASAHPDFRAAMDRILNGREE